MTQMTIKVTGLSKILRKMDATHLVYPEWNRAMSHAVAYLQGQVMERTPVDTGHLRSRITATLDPSPVPLWGLVGTNVLYARPVEFGSRPHWAPIGALMVWAAFHDMNPYALRGAIHVRGTRAHHMFERGMKAARPAIIAHLRTVARAIEARWSA